jgi:DNA ligase D-like protein (predicted ligase)
VVGFETVIGKTYEKKNETSVATRLAKTEGAKKKAQPTIIHPMLATLTHTYFYSPDWIYEEKFDGERCIAFKNGSKVLLKSRNNKSLNISYPEIEKAIESIGVKSIILDGEVVAFKGNLTNFSLLQSRMNLSNQEKIKTSRVAVHYCIFDLLYVDGYDVTKMPLIERKELLKKLFRFKDPLIYTPHTFKSSEKHFHAVCKKGWEGLIVKNAMSTYQHKRSSFWLKFKCGYEQELVIGGYTDPKRSRVGFGALLLGYYKGGKLHYAGKVGTGFDEATLRMLKKKFDAITTTKCPFINFDDSLKGVHWVTPSMVCEVGFTEWTRDNKLRHPRYLGLRRDKPAKKVIQEV